MVVLDGGGTVQICGEHRLSVLYFFSISPVLFWWDERGQANWLALICLGQGQGSGLSLLLLVADWPFFCPFPFPSHAGDAYH